MIQTAYFEDSYKLNKFLKTLKEEKLIDIKFTNMAMEREGYSGKYIMRYASFLVIYKNE